jgi:bifunctional oligoribonuclease and PAP phosphatase NrnA
VKRDVLNALKSFQRFVISSHQHPDCDALGSELAMADLLAGMGKKAVILNSDPMPEAFRFLDVKKRIKTFSPKRHAAVISQAEAIIVVDSAGNWDRLGRIGSFLALSAKPVITIDHHPDNNVGDSAAIIDTEASATAEIICELFKELHLALDLPTANALYAGIITDSGNFRYPKTTARTHRITAELLTAGVIPYKIYRQIYQQYPANWVRLKGSVLANMQLSAGGSLAWSVLRQEDLHAFHIRVDDLDGFASLAMDIAGVRLALFGVELPRQRLKISLRSDGTVPVDGIAHRWGGGGHPSASGATLSGEVPALLEELVPALEALLEEYPRPE